MAALFSRNPIRAYASGDLKGDLSAGLTVAVMLVPQAMAYAMLAGLPPVTGLYASTLPLIAYAAAGSSRQLAVGPVAMVSMLTYSAASGLAPPGSAAYMGYALLLAAMVGAVQLGLGLLRAGFLINFFSQAVISGFTSAAAVWIALSQLKHLLGIKIAAADSLFALIKSIALGAGKTHLVTLGIGVLSIGILAGLKKRFPAFPAAFIVVAFGALAVWHFRLDQMGVQIVGAVPQGLPAFSIPAFSISDIGRLAPSAAAIFFVGFMESIAVAKFIAAKERYEVSPDRELMALGLSNLTAAFFSGYPVTGGFSRTAVNYQAGAKTRAASLITALAMVLTLLFLTPLFYYLPNTVLAAVIIVAVAQLVEIEDARKLFKIQPSDGWTLAAAFFCTLFVGIERGLVIGVILSLALFIWRSSHPHTAELGFLKADGVFRNIQRYPDAQTFPHVMILRVDASLYFANMKFFEDRVHRGIAGKPEVKWVIVDFSGVNNMDAVAVHGLEKMMDAYRPAGIDFVFAEVKGPVRDLLKRAQWPSERFGYLSIPHALKDLKLIEMTVIDKKAAGGDVLDMV